MQLDGHPCKVPTFLLQYEMRLRHRNHTQNLCSNNSNNEWAFCWLQFGCCKPPEYCGFTMKNATFWEVPKKGPAVNESDCMKWSNEQNKLCYDCNSCKGGVLSNIRDQWKRLTTFNAVMLVIITSIYVLGCYAIRNNRSDAREFKHSGRRPVPWDLNPAC